MVLTVVLTYLPGSVTLGHILPRTGAEPPLPKTAASRYNYSHTRELAAYFRERARIAVQERNTPHRVRTCNLRFRRPMLYPIELGVRG
jgi:hypothetical protein